MDGKDCSGVRDTPNGDQGGHVSLLMLAHLKKVGHDEIFNDDITTAYGARPKVNYFDVHNQPDPFPDSSLLDPVDSDQHDAIVDAVEKMVTNANDNGFPDERMPELPAVVNDHIDIFRTSFSPGPPADFPALKIELQGDAKPFRVRLLICSQTQRSFLNKTVSMLVYHGMQSNLSLGFRTSPRTKAWSRRISFYRRFTSGERIHHEALVPDAQLES